MGKPKTKYDILDGIAAILSGPMHNSTTYEDGWRLSYLPYAPDTCDSETAIIIRDKTKLFGERMLILYGDHRNNLEGKSKAEAITYWKERPELHGATSNSIED